MGAWVGGDVAAADAGSIVGIVVDDLLGVDGERVGVVGLDLELVVAGGSDFAVTVKRGPSGWAGCLKSSLSISGQSPAVRAQLWWSGQAEAAAVERQRDSASDGGPPGGPGPEPEAAWMGLAGQPVEGTIQPPKWGEQIAAPAPVAEALS